eukprot:Nitzschia sp. Nitz4//scaffold72_size95085//86078//87917//NITZ4_004773-RA/size95085-processed-gene-0.38-mRNA-1//-1//CDS//3329557414//9465//frame0
MSRYLREAIKAFGEDVSTAATSPGGKNLFTVDETSPRLNTDKADRFHSIVAKLLYISQRGRPDLAPATAFLCTRVAKSTSQDWGKLKRLMQYINDTIDLNLTLGADSLSSFTTWVDAAYAVHPDMKSHTGGTISLGRGTLFHRSSKQKLNTKSSTEAELVGASDYLPHAIWTKHFLEEQGYIINEAVFAQDNQSAIKLEKNGWASAGQKSRHINIRYFFIKDRTKDEGITVVYCPTESMLADFFSKPLQGSLFKKFRDVILGHKHAKTLLQQQQQQQQQLEWKQVLFCILCRYDMIQGAGLQAGVPGKVMDVLMETLDCRMECFASPFNCRYGQYASAFGLDRCLGSLGSFFALELEEGCFQANPPFCEAFIKRFNLRMLHLLQVAQDNHKSLMFVVIVPTWKKSAAYQSLLDNTFLIHHLQLPQGKHWYTEGTQHRRKASFRVASFDTSLLFYQTTNAQTKWDIVSSTAETLSLLQEAFCQDPGQMIKQASSVVVGRDSSSNTTLEPNPKKRQRLAKDSASSPPPPPPKVQDVVPEPTTPSTTPQQGKRKRKQPKKKKSSKRTSILASNNPKEESQAQLNLLASLGLSSDKKNDSSQTIR